MRYVKDSGIVVDDLEEDLKEAKAVTGESYAPSLFTFTNIINSKPSFLDTHLDMFMLGFLAGVKHQKGEI